MEPLYGCNTETEKPKTLLVHEPGLETRLAIEDPDFWGFDPSLREDNFDFWLGEAQNEH